MAIVNILITEEAFNTGFQSIQVDDEFIIITDKKTFSGIVIHKYSTEIIVQFDGENSEKVLFTPNSIDGNKISGFVMEDGQKKKQTMVGFKYVLIKRDGNTVGTLTSQEDAQHNTDDRFNRFDNQERESGPQIEDIYDECSQVLSNLSKDDKLTINIGELYDEDEMKQELVGTIEIHIRETPNRDIIIGAVTHIEGNLPDKIAPIDSDIIKISRKESLEKNKNGVVLMVKTTDGKVYFIEGILGMEQGEYFNTQEPTFDELMQDKGFRDLMLKQPNIAAKLAGQMSKGVIPTNDILKQLNLNHDYFTRGKKVKFIYVGPPIRQGFGLSLKTGKEYIGIFSTSRSIKLTGTKRGESLILKLKKKTNENVYEIEVHFNKITDGQQQSTLEGRGIIQIRDINFR